MTSRLAHRLDRVARDLQIRYPCRICGGNGKHVVSKIHDDEPVPEVEGCAECGEVNHYVIHYVTMAAIAERGVCQD